MISEPPLPNRRSIRMPGYDYRTRGGYFVTLCAFQKRCVFGQSDGDTIRLHPYGRIVEEEWQHTAALRAEVTLDQYVIMPNHFHAIILIRDVGAHGNAPGLAPTQTLHDAQSSRAHCHAPLRASRSLSSLISGFKGSVTRRINLHHTERGLSSVTIWQRNYYERIIRDEKELHETQRYIIENPLYWAQDGYYRAE